MLNFRHRLLEAGDSLSGFPLFLVLFGTATVCEDLLEFLTDRSSSAASHSKLPKVNTMG